MPVSLSPDRTAAAAATAASSDAEARLVNILLAKRRAAVQARLRSALEARWLEAERAYYGEDDPRWRSRRHAIDVPPTPDGPVRVRGAERAPATGRSTVFVPLTARYVDAAAAKLQEILLPSDDKAFRLLPSPLPDLLDALDDPRQLVTPDGQPLLRDAEPHEGGLPPHLAPPGTGPAVPLTVKDLAQERLVLARQRAERAERRIFDWLQESDWITELRAVIFDAALYGVGILKGPYPIIKQRIARTTPAPDLAQVTLQTRLQPGVKRVSPWDFFPDPLCGADIHAGEYVWEREYLTARQLAALMADPGDPASGAYLPTRLAAVLAAGPQAASERDAGARDWGPEHPYEVWHYQGVLTREDIATINPALAQTLPETTRPIPVICTLINDTIVRVGLHVLDSGRFTYHLVPWRRQQDDWAGIGVAAQIEAAARILNAATRELLNNAGFSSGVQIVLDRIAIEPANGDWTITPNKIWFKNEESRADSVEKAFTVVNFPNLTTALMEIIRYALQLAEESTNIPLVTQGYSGRTTPQTLGATQLQDSNANQLLRQVAGNFDRYLLVPLVQQFYEWLLADADVPDEEKGDWTVQAQGSTVLVERYIQQQTIAALGGLVTNPSFRIDPVRWMAQYLKANRLNPEDFQYTPDEWERLMAQQAQIKPPQVQAAEIRAQAQVVRTQLQEQGEQARAQAEQQARLAELQLQLELEQLRYANLRNLTLEQVKAQLAQTAMKLRVQRELAAEDRAAEALAPPTEPPGRAPAGQSYER